MQVTLHLNEIIVDNEAYYDIYYRRNNLHDNVNYLKSDPKEHKNQYYQEKD